MDDFRALHTGICYLAAMDPDNATVQNNVGFSKPHSYFGKRMANIRFEEWDDAMIYTAWDTLRHYKGQLASCGINWDDIPTPPTPNKEAFLERAKQTAKALSIPRVLKIDPDSGDLMVSWGKHETIVNEFKEKFAFEEKRWDKDRYKGWWIYPQNIDTIDKVFEFAERWGITITDEALLRLQVVRSHFEKGTIQQKEIVAPIKTGRYVVPHESNPLELRVYFDYNHKVYYAISTARDKITGEIVDDRYKAFVRRYEDNKTLGKNWIITCIDDKAIALLKKFTDEYGFEYRDGAGERLEQIKNDSEKNKAASSAMDTDFRVRNGLLRELRPFQHAGVQFALLNGNIVNADEMGTGKSIQSIALTYHLESYPTLIICPASLKYNWLNEIKMTVPYASVSVYEGGDPNLTTDWLIINYDMITKKLDHLLSRQWAHMICDEAHKLKSHKAAWSKSVLELSQKCVNRVTLLTGTPLMNKPDDLIMPLRIVGKMNSHFKNITNFQSRYCNMSSKTYGSKTYRKSGEPTNLSELNQHLRNGIMIRRLKKDVLKELPPMTRSTIHLKIDNRSEYDKAERDIVEYVREFAVNDKRFLETIKDLPSEEKEKARREHANDKAYKAARAEILVKINHLRQIAAKGKLAQVKKWVEEFLESGEKLIIFGYYQSVVEEFGHAFNAPMIYGSVDAKKRQQYVEAFQNDSETKLLVLNMDSGGVGLTLTAASNSVFVELNWNPARITQAEARVSRMGQKFPQTIYYFIDPTTIDSYMMEMVFTKQAIIDEAIDGNENEGFAFDEEVSNRNAMDYANELLEKYGVEGVELENSKTVRNYNPLNLP